MTSYSMVAKVFSWQDAAMFKRLGATTVMRYFVSDQPIGGDPEAAARRDIERYHSDLDTYHRSVDYIEGRNEQVSSSDRAANQWLVDYETAFAYQIAAGDWHTKACVIDAAVGNPKIDWVVDLVPAVRAACETGGCVGYHGYWWANRTESGLDSWFQWHAGRWMEWDKVFDAYGLQPNYILTECGVVASSDGRALNAHAGWKHRDCLNGDWSRYVAQIGNFEQRIDAWNASHQNRCLGFVLFTSSGFPMGWETFQIQKAEMERLAARP